MNPYLKILAVISFSLSLPIIGNSYADTYQISLASPTPKKTATPKPTKTPIKKTTDIKEIYEKKTSSTPKPIVNTPSPIITPTPIPITTTTPIPSPTPTPTPKEERNADEVDVYIYNQINNIEANTALILKIVNSDCAKSPDNCNSNDSLNKLSLKMYEEMKLQYPLFTQNLSQEKIKYMLINSVSIKDRLGEQNISKLNQIQNDTKNLNLGLYKDKTDEIIKLATLPKDTIITPTPAPTPSVNPLQDGKIVFVSERDENPEIYLMSPDGKYTQRLTQNNSFDIMPSFSPDGTKIAFVSERDGNPEIYVMNSDGTSPMRLTNNYSYDYSPSWSPDGSKIIFVSNRGDTNIQGQGTSPVSKISFKIYVMNADGTNQTKLTENSFEDESPKWSPDGSKIAFVSKRDGNSEIYVMNSDGTSSIRLTNSPTFDIMPAWSPDGSKIAFRSDRDGNPEIYVMSSDGTNLKRVTKNLSSDESPAWSPDGNKLLFVSRRDNIKNANEDFVNEIYVMNSDSSNITRLTNNNEDDNSPSWSK
ncbi:MAG: DUF5050 domain-containing protein [Candidatus Sericytochromatia bacterium]